MTTEHEQEMKVTFIRNTADGRAIEVIGPYVCVARVPVADRVVEVASHPNREAILAAVPNATHMAGPIALTEVEASAVRGALMAAETPFRDSADISRRMRDSYNTRARNSGIE